MPRKAQSPSRASTSAISKAWSFPRPIDHGQFGPPVFTAARRVMVKEVENRVQQLLADNDGAFRLTESGQLLAENESPS